MREQARSGALGVPHSGWGGGLCEANVLTEQDHFFLQGSQWPVTSAGRGLLDPRLHLSVLQGLHGFPHSVLVTTLLCPHMCEWGGFKCLSQGLGLHTGMVICATIMNQSKREAVGVLLCIYGVGASR